LRSIHLGARPWIIGHRGAAPDLENSLAAFRRALREGADAVECDVQPTRDGALVVFHDETLERFGGDATRPISAIDLEELRAFQPRPPASGAAADFSGGAKIPTLAELFAALPETLAINVEVKVYAGGGDRLVDPILAALQGRGNVFVSSFDRRFLGQLRRAAPELPLAVLADRFDDDLEALADELGAWGIHLAEPPSPARLGKLHRPVLVYTVNEPVLARRLLARGLAGLFTDRPGELRAALGLPPPGKRVWAAPPTVV
jgi:glycerophosphoryl diester phosphodiesterase